MGWERGAELWRSLGYFTAVGCAAVFYSRGKQKRLFGIEIKP